MTRIARLALTLLSWLTLLAVLLVLPETAAAGKYRPPNAWPAPPDSALTRLASVESQREQARELNIHGPAARSAPTRSRTAYRHLGPRRAFALYKSDFGFPAPLRALEPAPGRRRVRAASSTSEFVVNEHGRRELLLSTMPLSVGVGSVKRPLDLTLAEEGTTFTPRASNAPVQISAHLAAGARLPTAGFSVALDTASDVKPMSTSGAVFWPNAATDSDYIAAPTYNGFEDTLALRSSDSPEHFRFQVTMPPGATLEHAVSPHPIPNDPPRSLVVLSAKRKPLGYISPVTAIDAAGNPVPADLHLANSGFIVDVRHRNAEVQYPVQVDPTIAIYASGGDWAGWQWGQSRTNSAGTDSYFGMAINDPNYMPGGLYQSMPTNSFFSPGDFAQYYWFAPAGTYLYQMNFGNWGHQPYYSNAINGTFDPATSNWVAGTSYVNATGGTGGNPWIGNFAVNSATHTYCPSAGGTAYNPTCSSNPPPDGTYAAMALQINNNGGWVATTNHRATSTMAYAYEFLGDRYPPSFASVSAPSGWSNASTATATAHLTDVGLGIKSINIGGGSAASISGYSDGCTGDPYHSPCQHDVPNAQVSYTVPEGVSQSYLSATDAFTNAAYSNSFTSKVDTTAPSIALSGQLSGGGASLIAVGSGSYSLGVDATDGNYGGPPASQGSGVATIDIKVDGVTQGAVTQQSNSADSAPLHRDWTLNGASLTEGQHTVTVTVSDRVAHTKATSITVLEDRTAPSENLSGPLWDARNATIGNGQFSVGADALDGDDTNSIGSGLASIELLIDGADASPATYRVTQGCPNGDCDQSADFSVDTSRLTPGSHQFEMDVKDQAGNQATTRWALTVSSSAPGPESPPRSAASTPTSAMSISTLAAVNTTQGAFPTVVAPSQSATDSSFVPKLLSPALSADPANTDGTRAMASASSVDIPVDPTGAVTVSTNWGPLQMAPLNVAASAQPGAVLNGTAVLFADTSQSADTIVRPTVLGASLFTQIRDSAAPETYSWSLNLADNESLLQLSDGAVAIYGYTTAADAQMTPGSPSADAAATGPVVANDTGDPGTSQDVGPVPPWPSVYQSARAPAINSSSSYAVNNVASASQQIQGATTSLSQAASQLDPSRQFLLGVIQAPFAMSANGQPVATALSVNNNVVTLTVSHRSAGQPYPIIADPSYVSCTQRDPCGSYNARAATAYAIHWRNSFNPAYVQFNGDDCTNFMSQIYRAGGAALLGEGDSSVRGGWWLVRNHYQQPKPRGESIYWRYTHSWSVASDFEHHLLQYGLAKRTRGGWVAGDMVAWDWHADGSVNHMNFVAQVINGVPYIVQHSNEYPTPLSIDQVKRNAANQNLTPLRYSHLRLVHTAANIP